MNEPGSSWPMCLSAALTIVPSRNTAPDPMTVQISASRCGWSCTAPARDWLASRAHCHPVSQRRDDDGKVRRLSAMPGPVALVGAGEFLPEMAEFDQELLASTGRVRPRVAILPTASSPDGNDVFDRWAAMGVAHFASLGAEV